MRAWRIYPHNAPYARAADFDPLDGSGGRIAANRWNEPGNPLIYAAANPSLAALEVLAHLARPADFGERTIIEVELPEDIETVSLELLLRLREDAPADDPELLTREFGTRWIHEKRSLALVAPSFVMPFDRNILINPLHERASELNIVRQEKMRLDARLVPGTYS